MRIHGESDSKGRKILRVAAILLLVLILLGTSIFLRIQWPSKLVIGEGPERVIAVGDSITYGLGVISTRDIESYPTMLAALLGEDYTVENFGMSGRTLLSTTDASYFSEELGQQTFDSEADIVLFMLGTNDARAVHWDANRYASEYREIILKYLALPSKPTVFILAPPKVFTPVTDENSIDNAIIQEEILPIIERLADETAAHFINLYDLTRSHEDYFSDGIHPNAQGNRLISEHIYEEVIRVRGGR